MRSKAIAVAGLVIFVVLVTCPFWYAQVPVEGKTELERRAAEAGVNCVLDKGTGDEEEMTDKQRIAWMTANHMDQLDRWRNDVVRGAGSEEECTVTVTQPSRGEVAYAKSLTGTCLANCHTMDPENTRKRSCVQCHEYANVEPTCMDCHVEPKGD